MKNQLKWSASRTKTMKTVITSIILFLIAFQQSYAQDGNAGITEATGKIRGYFDR